MTSSEWGILIGMAGALLVPTIMAWIALWVRLSPFLYRLDLLDKKHAETMGEIKRLWEVHNHQEGRLYAQDRMLMAVMRRVGVDVADVDFALPKEPGK